ncbi:hypothetical protein Kpol_1028p89 [Vanderwaltozyma polyspora DSM 70294]|uniref:Uncharacterized protein n=1 Tax=Vanderwaltozyma polyspora (strain ATCC 22028 / DSM 70294 / BCRC 21397 / CBS 2163 / NBRC 10782 / NRRL Y-8283 / UCD 57-17) TaxID=436907 RepID=A7TG56_VANPO|nr:uncharacterized protein Kpol_1028p89 [Vanderwaltozyma polyspora DSM 70294]EDO18813.1 hypothetical protein Kpol_1028p89 [Vanderwaltozyma polyspora DSM 70294]
MQSISGGSNIPSISNNDISKFSQLFDRSANGLNYLPGDKAKDIFLKANLDNATLGSIWALCDQNQDGTLTKPEFIMAMHLLQLTLSNNPEVNPLPSQLPQELWNSIHLPNGTSPMVTPTSPSADVDWILPQDQKDQFDKIFDSLDKSNEGKLSSQVLVPFFLSSKLNQDTLATIWDLSDLHNHTDFTKLEFAIAMFLIQKKNSGIPLPETLPQQLLNSPSLAIAAATPQHGIPAQPVQTQIPQQRVPTNTSISLPANASIQPNVNISNTVPATISRSVQPADNSTRANQELSRINEMKASIESKLSMLQETHKQNIAETEELESNVAVAKREVEALKQQLAMLETNNNDSNNKILELNQKLTTSRQLNKESKDKIQYFNNMIEVSGGKLEDNKIKLKQENSMVDVNTKQLELNHNSLSTLTSELQNMSTFLVAYLAKHKELGENQKSVENQHSQLQLKYKALDDQNKALVDKDNDLKKYTLDIEAQEKEYHAKVDRLQSLFDDLSKKKMLFEQENELLKKKNLEYAQNIQSLSERQMKLAMGELPDDADDVLKNAKAFSTTTDKLTTTDDGDRTESDVFDKDVPTVGSQTEGEPEDETTVHVNAANPLNDRFDSDMTEFNIPRTQSLTSSVANNPPLSVRDDVEMPELGDPLEENVANSEVMSETPAEWNTSQAEANGIAGTSNGADRELNLSDNINELKGISSKNGYPNIDEEFPPIRELDVDESDSSSDEDNNNVQTSNMGELNDEFADLELAPLEDGDADNLQSRSVPQPELSVPAPQPVSSNPTTETAGISNDEWNQVFSGLGSSSQPDVVQGTNTLHTPTVPVIDRKLATTPKSLAIEELCGMGFTEDEAVKALEKHNWDLDAATNFLLDNA